MRKFILFISVLLVLVLISACTSGGNATNNGLTNDDAITVEEVEELVKASCANCHGGNIESVPGSHLSLSELEEVILEGKGNMPAIEVTKEEAKMIAEYLTDE